MTVSLTGLGRPESPPPRNSCLPSPTHLRNLSQVTHVTVPSSTVEKVQDWANVHVFVQRSQPHIQEITTNPNPIPTGTKGECSYTQKPVNLRIIPKQMTMSADETTIVSFLNIGIQVWKKNLEGVYVLDQIYPTKIPTCVAVDSCGDWIGYGESQGKITLHNLKTEKSTHLTDSDRTCVAYIAFSPNGRHIVSVLVDKTIQLWDYLSSTLIYTWYADQMDAIQAVTFADENHIALTQVTDQHICTITQIPLPPYSSSSSCSPVREKNLSQ